MKKTMVSLEEAVMLRNKAITVFYNSITGLSLCGTALLAITYFNPKLMFLNYLSIVWAAGLLVFAYLISNMDKEIQRMRQAR